MILNSITAKISTTYQLTSLLWEAAAICFPQNYSWQWDCVSFEVDLTTMSLSVELSTYPNQFGAARQKWESLTAERFHEIAVQFQFSEVLQQMQTEEDWQALSDNTLQQKVAENAAALKQQAEDRRQQEQLLYAVTIPNRYRDMTPRMEVTKAELELRQRFGSSKVRICKQEDGVYKFCTLFVAYKALSPAEAAWFEDQLDAVINDADTSTWQSMVGYDYLNVTIIREGKSCVDISCCNPPLQKYKTLLDLLKRLELYGSRFEE